LGANAFLGNIQQHWGIENRLHWVRDVTFQKSYACLSSSAPMVWAILNCFVIVIVCQLGFRTIP
jgi:hypothetical protein